MSDSHTTQHDNENAADDDPSPNPNATEIIETSKEKLRIPSLPPDFLAHKDGWEEINNGKLLQVIVSEDQYRNEHFTTSIIETYESSVKKVDHFCESIGNDSSNVSTFKALVPESVVSYLVEYTSQELVSNSHRATTIPEYYEFLATFMLVSRFKLSRDDQFEVLEMIAANKGFQLMSIDRYNELLHCTRGTSMTDREGMDEDDEWIPNKHVMDRIRKMEQLIFEQTIELLYNKRNGHLVVDNELVASCADDVTKKNLNKRKKRKGRSSS